MPTNTPDKYHPYPVVVPRIYPERLDEFRDSPTVLVLPPSRLPDGHNY